MPDSRNSIAPPPPGSQRYSSATIPRPVWTYFDQLTYFDLILTNFEAIITLRLTYFDPVSTYFEPLWLLGVFFGELSVWVSERAAFGAQLGCFRTVARLGGLLREVP